MTIKEFESKYKVKFEYSTENDYYAEELIITSYKLGFGQNMPTARAYFTELLNPYTEMFADNSPEFKSDFLKVVENLERIRKYKGKTIAGVIEEFNKKHWNKYECGVTDDEGYDYPLYVVTDMKGNRLTDMQCGMISILRYKQFTPEFGLAISSLFNDIFNIEELENED